MLQICQKYPVISAVFALLVLTGTVCADSEKDNNAGHSVYGPALQAWLNTHGEHDVVEVNITLHDTGEPQSLLKPEILVSDVDETGTQYHEKDGVEITEQEAEIEAGHERQTIEHEHARHKMLLDDKSRELLARLGWSLQRWRQSDGVIISTLQKEEIVAVAAMQDLVETMERYKEIPRTAFSSVYDAMVATGLKKWGHLYRSSWASPTSGSGISIYMQEPYGDCPTPFGVNDPNSTLYHQLYKRQVSYPTGKASDAVSANHALSVYFMLRHSAPGANVYCGFSNKGLVQTAQIQGPHAPPGNPLVPARFDLVSLSWGIHNPSGGYTLYDEQADQLVYDRRVTGLIVASGNTNKTVDVGSPARAYNAIAVSHYDQTTNRLETYSVSRNSMTGAEKPELMAPGTKLCVSEASENETASCIGNVLQTGSSMAAPLVAGFAANLMQRYDWISPYPTRLKSMLMAGAAQKLHVANGSRLATEAEVGAGAVDFHPTTFNAYTFLFSGWVNGKGPGWDLFDAGTRFRNGSDIRSGSDRQGRYIDIDMIRRPLVKGVKYRVAMVWLVPPRTKENCKNWVNSEKGKSLKTVISDRELASCRNKTTVDMNFDMEVFQKIGAGRYISYGASRNNKSAYELLEFVAKQNGISMVRIRYKADPRRHDRQAKQNISVTLTPVYFHSNTP